MGKKQTRGWLCLNPCSVKVGETVTVKDFGPDVIAVLCVYRTKKAARAVHGKDET